MENLDWSNVAFIILLAILILKYFEFKQLARQEKQNQQELETIKIVRCSVEYDPDDPKHKMIYVFDRENNQFLTQAESIKQAVVNLVEQQKYTTITFHPDHCPPEVFEQTRQITINDFAKVKQ
jgi:hypothetical protein